MFLNLDLAKRMFITLEQLRYIFCDFWFTVLVSLLLNMV